MLRTKFRILMLLAAFTLSAGVAAAQNRACPRGNAPARHCPAVCTGPGNGPRACARGAAAAKGQSSQQPGAARRAGMCKRLGRS